MKVIIAGSRHLLINSRTIDGIVKASGFEITEVVSGHCRGIDTDGEYWARRHEIPTKLFPADWKQWGKSAGPIRNNEMAQYAEALILIWDGRSKGSFDVLNRAKQYHLKIHEHIINHLQELLNLPF